MKQKISLELLERICSNARLSLSKEEKERFVSELEEVLEAFSKIDEVDVEKVKLTLQPVEVKNVLREDKVEKDFSQEEALSLTKHKEKGFFKGPKIVGE